MKQLLLCLVLSLASFTSAQTIAKEVIASGGEAITNGEIFLNSTIGEPLIGAVTNNFSIDQGFWSGGLLIVPLMPEEELDGIVVFPNPVEDELSIITNNNRVFGLTMFSVDGRMVYREKVDESQTEHQIDASALANGVYVLQIFVEGSSEEKLFKIIKR